MSEQERELKAAIAFAQTKPTEWDAFKQRWLKDNPEQTPIVEPLVQEPVVEEETPKTRKKKPATEE
jgi:hypothetical protein